MGKYWCGNFIYWVIAAAAVTVVACNSPENGTVKKNSQPQSLPLPAKPAMANPAAVKCVQDGYLLEPVVENGVSVGHLCVNPRTGLQCEIWKYFRNECALEP